MSEVARFLKLDETDETDETLHHPHHPLKEKEEPNRVASSVPGADETAAQRQAAIIQAWKRGRLRYKLDANQRRINDHINSRDCGSYYFDKPRRIGGSYLLCVRAVEMCLRKPFARVPYAAPTAKNVRKIVGPNLRKIFEDCPQQFRPKFNALDGEFRFPHNGASLVVAGCDNQQYEGLRGAEADEVEIDEVGFIDDLEYIITDVLMPQLQDTEGKLILAGTPPRSPQHPATRLAIEHKAMGDYWHSTVYDNPRLTADKRDRFLRKLARGVPIEQFIQSASFRREYLAEHIVDQEAAVVPEWSAEREKALCIDLARPGFFDPYVSLDVGWKDGMAALFGYWDFRKAALVIEDEWLAFRVTATVTADAIRRKEAELWPGRTPYLRVADNDLLTIADLSERGVAFIPTAKDDKELQVNQLREWVRSGKLIVNPRCKRLISQLAGTTWNKQRTSYERTDDGHGDLLDALVYMVRNIRRERNPFPSDVPDFANMVVFQPQPTSRLAEAFDELWTLNVGEA